MRTGFLDRLGGALLEPGRTFNRIIAESRGVAEPLLLIIIFFAVQGGLIGVFVSRMISSFITATGPWMGVGAGQIQAFSGFIMLIPAITIVSGLIGALILWVISGGLAHLCAKYVFKGTGSYIQLLKLYGYATVPMALVIVGTIVAEINIQGIGYLAILSLIATFWMVIILVVAVERCHQIDPGKAFISAFILPLVIYVIIVTVIGWGFAATAGAFFGGFPA